MARLSCAALRAAFVDGIVEGALARSDVAGAVVVVVANGAPVLLRGYGWADVAKRAPVDAHTLFRPGSISKLFTAIAVLQLVERGELELDADVASAIDFDIPRAFGKPVTLRQLLTHRAGFEERMRGMGQGPGAGLALRDFLRSGVPRRSLEPERWPSYSNYGIALAGYLVERTAGLPFEDYAAQHLLGPLGMQRATFAQPLPPEVAPLMSEGYRVASLPPGPFERINSSPAGALSASGDAMARFLLMLLGGGELDGVRVLSPQSFARFVEPQLRVAENALGLAIYEQHAYGVRLLGHGGDTSYFHSELAFSPEHGFGVFVSQNSWGNGAPMLRSAVIPALVKRYFATPERTRGLAVEASASAAPRGEPPRDVRGAYLVTRRADSTLMRIGGLSGQIAVSVPLPGLIETRGILDAAGRPQRWREIAPDRFRSVDGRSELGFERDARGRAVRLLPPWPGVTFERARWVDTQAFGFAVLGSAIAIALGTLVAPSAGRLTRRALGAQAPPARPLAFRVLAPLTAGLWLAQVATATFVFSRSSIEFWRLSRGEDGLLIGAIALAWLAAAASLATGVALLPVLRDSRRSLARRAASALPVLAFAGLTWFVWNWGQLSNPLSY